MVSVALLFVLSGMPATTPSASGLEQERFKIHFTRGEALFEQGEYGAAIWNFLQADEVRKTPEVAYDLAKSHEKLGDREYSTYYYRLYLRRSPAASDALDVAERVGDVLASVEANGKGMLELEASGAGQATLRGKTWPSFPVAAFLPPGDYEVAVRFPAGTRKRWVSIRTGKVTSLKFEPVPPPLVMLSGPQPREAEWASPMPEVTRSAATASGSERSVLHGASYGVLGASAAALVAGTLLGGIAGGQAASLQQNHSGFTVSAARDRADAASSAGSAANVLWVAGGLGALAGGAMFVLSLPSMHTGQGAHP